ncbi:hypothetical protein GC173_06060 [bacterium]|nr:hypothetical protein [bacterium]
MNPELQSKGLVVGLDAWMVLFGAIPDVGVGDVVWFALRAIPVVAELGCHDAGICHLGLNYYTLGGVLRRGDAGVMTLETELGPLHVTGGALPHAWVDEDVRGEFELVVDADAPDRGRALHPWRVRSITRETSNWRDRRTEENRPIRPGRRLLKFSDLLKRPGLRFQGSEVDRSNAVGDDGGLAHYNIVVEPAGKGTTCGGDS